MKKWCKGILILVGCLGVAGVSGAIWQRENVRALYEGVHYSEEELQQQIDQTQKEVDEVLNQYTLKEIRELTEEEKMQLVTGELSIEEATERILQVPEPSQKSSSASVQASLTEEKESNSASVQPPKQIQKDETEIVTLYTAKMYALQSKYTGMLSGIESQGWGLLNSYTSGNKTARELMPQGMVLVQQAVSLESQCDGEVEKILQSLGGEMSEIGGDKGIVETMRKAYQTEKRSKKAYYLSLIPKI